MNIRIRPAEASDAESLIALARATIAASYPPILGAEAVAGFIGSGASDDYVRENLPRCRVIEDAGEIVGFAVCRENLIDLMMVAPHRHRQGFGTRLLADAEAELFREYGELRLESFEGNGPANSFYRKHGWQEDRRYFDPDSGVNKIAFRKTPPANR